MEGSLTPFDFSCVLSATPLTFVTLAMRHDETPGVTVTVQGRW